MAWKTACTLTTRQRVETEFVNYGSTSASVLFADSGSCTQGYRVADTLIVHERTDRWRRDGGEPGATVWLGGSGETGEAMLVTLQLKRVGGFPASYGIPALLFLRIRWVVKTLRAPFRSNCDDRVVEGDSRELVRISSTRDRLAWTDEQ